MLSKSKFQTQRLATRLARDILGKNFGGRRKALAIALSGELGAGKTTFIQGFVKALGIKRHITSPTFLIMRRYSLPSQQPKAESGKFLNAYHIDLYRVHKPREILDLGFKEIINNPRNIVLIEWPEKIRNILPRSAAWIYFRHGKTKEERGIKITGGQLVLN